MHSYVRRQNNLDEQYSFFKGFLRIDPFEAELKMYRITSGELPEAEAMRLVDEILQVYPDDPTKILFGGLTAIQYGDFDRAARLLQLKGTSINSKRQLFPPRLSSQRQRFQPQHRFDVEAFL